MYGEQNKTLSYLPHLAANGVELAEIPQSGHFPMYSNAREMWRRIAASRRMRPSVPCSRRPPAPDQSAPPAASGVPEP